MDRRLAAIRLAFRRRISAAGFACGRRRLRTIGSAAPGAIEDELDRSDLDAIAAGVLGAIKRVIGLRQQRREVEHGVVADHDADAYGGDDRPAVDFAGGLGERSADLLGNGQRPLARRVDAT